MLKFSTSFNPAEAREWFKSASQPKISGHFAYCFNPAEAREWFKRQENHSVTLACSGFNPAEARKWFKRQEKGVLPPLSCLVSIQPKQENGLRDKKICKAFKIHSGFNPAEAREWFKSQCNHYRRK